MIIVLRCAVPGRLEMGIILLPQHLPRFRNVRKPSPIGPCLRPHIASTLAVLLCALLFKIPSSLGQFLPRFVVPTDQLRPNLILGMLSDVAYDDIESNDDAMVFHRTACSAPVSSRLSFGSCSLGLSMCVSPQ
jgi:hypothetical protein